MGVSGERWQSKRQPNDSGQRLMWTSTNNVEKTNRGKRERSKRSTMRKEGEGKGRPDCRRDSAVATDIGLFRENGRTGVFLLFSVAPITAHGHRVCASPALPSSQLALQEARCARRRPTSQGAPHSLLHSWYAAVTIVRH
jgi:hypothetical protein